MKRRAVSASLVVLAAIVAAVVLKSAQSWYRVRVATQLIEKLQIESEILPTYAIAISSDSRSETARRMAGSFRIELIKGAGLFGPVDYYFVFDNGERAVVSIYFGWVEPHAAEFGFVDNETLRSGSPR